MRMIHEKTVWQLTWMPRIFPVNAYLIEEEDGLTLIDAALPYSAKGILQVAGRIGKPIVRMVLTHAHSDHIGAVKLLKQELPAVKLHISERDSRLLAGDRSLDAHEPSTAIQGGVPKPGQIDVEPDILLRDGDRVGSLLAIATPGHTPGSMSFLDTRNDALIAGDAMQTRGGVAVSGQLKLWFPFPAMATWNKGEALASARKLQALKPSLLAVGHGRMLIDPLQEMDRAIGEAEHAILKQRSVQPHVPKNRP